MESKETKYNKVEILERNEEKRHISSRSLIDPSISTNTHRWVLSMVRKPLEQHAFIVVEGIHDNGEIFIRKYDLVDDNQNPGYTLIIMKEEKGAPTEIKTKFNKIIWCNIEGDELVYKAWGVDKQQGTELHNNVFKDHMRNIPRVSKEKLSDEELSDNLEKVRLQNDNIRVKMKYAMRYNCSGIDNISGESDTRSSRKGHNCITWVLEKLRNLNDPRINVDTMPKLTDKLIAIPSAYIRTTTDAEHSYCSIL